MICPICGSELSVVCTRQSDDVVVRKRRCTNCNHTIYTQEILADYDYWKTIEREYMRKLHESANNLQRRKRQT